MRKFKLVALFMALSLAVFSFSACGGKDDKKEDTNKEAVADDDYSDDDYSDSSDSSDSSAEGASVELTAEDLGQGLCEGPYQDDEGAYYEFEGGAPVIDEASDGGNLYVEGPDGEAMEGYWNVCNEEAGIVLYLDINDTQIISRLTNVDAENKMFYFEGQDGSQTVLQYVGE